MKLKKTDATRSAGWLRVGLVSFLFVAALTPNSEFLIPDSHAAAAAPLTFPSLNGTYTMDGAAIAPVRRGGVTIHLSSPSNRLVVEENSLALEPAGDGTHRVRVTVGYLGKGELVARFETSSGTSSPMRDEVVVPRQTLELEGRARFRRVPSGWEVTVVELPPETRVDVRSRLANSLVTTCQQLAAFLGLDCDGLDRSLNRVAVPLPEPGSVFFLEEADLTPEEARRLDARLKNGSGIR